ncbi:MAG TPA: nucleotidyl transferase AbiEii/AbiGii toxin family protein [Bacteroidota bacterium]|nr:nucleotidyl transferase AbiEii/AbiGii toxin family protein [Bacteroidota bacterium]
MITIAEVQRVAGSLGVTPAVIDHDYVIGCFLHFLGSQQEVRRSWLFKGGTSLQKCHFGGYRFSEDIDFTMTDALTSSGLLSIVNSAKEAMQDGIGIKTDQVATRVETIEDDYARESLEARIYYRGPWIYGGPGKSLQIHVSCGEVIFFPVLEKTIIHPYSDANQLAGNPLSTYSLEEVFAEKLRAFSGQQKHAIARDVFDLYYLMKRGVDLERAISVFPEKCKTKGIDRASLSLDTPRNRQEDYRLNWERNLEYLVPRELKIPFDDAWNSALASLEKALES